MNQTQTPAYAAGVTAFHDFLHHGIPRLEAFDRLRTMQGCAAENAFCDGWTAAKQAAMKEGLNIRFEEGPGYALAIDVLTAGLAGVWSDGMRIRYHDTIARQSGPQERTCRKTHLNSATDGDTKYLGLTRRASCGIKEGSFYTRDLHAVDCKRCAGTKRFKALSRLASLGAVGAVALAEAGGVQ